MPCIIEPCVLYPDYIVQDTDILNFITTYHSNSRSLAKASEMIKNTTIQKRHTFIQFDDIINLKGFQERQRLYEECGRKYSEAAARQALLKSGLNTSDITMVIVVSCTGFMMPSLTSHLINTLNLNEKTIQLPIAQMGCVGGAYAINRAYEHCSISNKNNALIVAFEACSLCFDRDADQLEDFISDAIFGDGVASLIVTGNQNSKGLHLNNARSVFLHSSEDYIAYDITDKGFKFSLNKRVMQSVGEISKQLNDFVIETKSPNDQLDFVISHTGGKKILDEVETHLGLQPSTLTHSRSSLREFGNTSSVSVIDVLLRHFDTTQHGDFGIIVAFGPGFTCEISSGYWVK